MGYTKTTHDCNRIVCKDASHFCPCFANMFWSCACVFNRLWNIHFVSCLTNMSFSWAENLCMHFVISNRLCNTFIEIWRKIKKKIYIYFKENNTVSHKSFKLSGNDFLNDDCIFYRDWQRQQSNHLIIYSYCHLEEDQKKIKIFTYRLIIMFRFVKKKWNIFLMCNIASPFVFLPLGPKYKLKCMFRNFQMHINVWYHEVYYIKNACLVILWTFHLYVNV